MIDWERDEHKRHLITEPKILAEELRQMAAGEGKYSRFLYASFRIKVIWKSAADWIEKSSRGTLP